MTDFLAVYPGRCWDVPHAPEAVAETRALVRAALTEWGVPALISDAELLVSELVTNALVHGAAPIVLALNVIGPAMLAGTVHDGGGDPLCLRASSPDDTGGRGLAIIRALATSWGVWPEPGGKPGKTVWFILTAPLPVGLHESLPVIADREVEP
ncbi:ATP-binding protein [Sphaerisporangium aureirubrum]|uniref:ATP-binding protein n=1 Tax=Sphaerisporangium aureirubrum TaxID=1544736 RepID=A0ABW1NB18_9ACTN